MCWMLSLSAWQGGKTFEVLDEQLKLGDASRGFGGSGRVVGGCFSSSEPYCCRMVAV